MSFDKAIAELTAALIENTEALKAIKAGQGVTAAVSSKPIEASEAPEVKETTDAKDDAPRKRGRPAKSGDAPAKESGYEAKYTQSEMQAAVNEVKNELGVAEAKRLIKEVGGHDKLVDVTDAKAIDALYEAAKALLTGGSEEECSEEDDI